MSAPTNNQPYIAQNSDAPAYWHVGILWAMLATGDQTGGHFSLMEEWCPKDSGPPPHYHDQDEAFYLIDGTITFLTNGQTMQASTGAFVFIPGGTVHSFRVDSDTAHILNFYTPAGFEQIVMRQGVPAQTRTIPPEEFKEPPLDGPTMMQLFQQYGMHSTQEPDVLRQHS
ncbi:cupin [Dictyobacter alpinus]|uniref:Cupin n=1 Tax=Dictyobacter alpinus TaxID=2014873 RepID=A0A402B3F1_9CHLR|nr:cupin domain-containing protein [Dictyobacter alpinus]GCE25875.1 cupin [Dictyobacter alpinus]